MTEEELDEAAAVEESILAGSLFDRPKLVLYDEDEPPAPGESMPKVVGTRERARGGERMGGRPLAKGEVLSVLFGEDEVVRDSDGRPYTTHPNPPAPPRDITFVEGSGGYREAPQTRPTREPVIEPLSCEAARATWRGYQILEGGFAGGIASIIIYWLLS